MTAPAADSLVVPAYRFVHGKVVTTPGGPVDPQFEHRPTSISKDMPPCLIPYCRPRELLAKQSIQALVHPSRQGQGALFFQPCACDGRQYMVASCVRARPEGGDSGLGRTHTQLISYVFHEPDWQGHAPLLLANAGRWLRAEPDTRAFHEAGDFPIAKLGDELLVEVPPCLDGPLPKGGNLLWRLAAALEDGVGVLCCGHADGIRSADHFLRAMACLAALTPGDLRIYLSMAAGFAREQKGFAIQFLPEAPRIPGVHTGFLEQYAGQIRKKHPVVRQDTWQQTWVADPRSAEIMKWLNKPGGWSDASGARAHLAQRFDILIAQHSTEDLTAWLNGTRPKPPRPPLLHQELAAKDWVQTLTVWINEHLASGDPSGLARAIFQTANLTGTGDKEREREKRIAFWSKAWREAGTASPDRDALRWSALGAERLQSSGWDTGGWAEDVIRDFGELAVITRAIRFAREESPESAELVTRALDSQAFNERLGLLRRQADRILTLRPRTLIDLAHASPSLLRRRKEDDAFAADLRDQTLLCLRLVTGPLTSDQPRDRELEEAARRLAEGSLKISLQDDGNLLERVRADNEDETGYLRALLRRYWRWALGPSDQRDPECMLWLDGVRDILRLILQDLGLAAAAGKLTRCFQGACDDAEEAGQQKEARAQASENLTRVCLAALAPEGADPVATAEGLLQSVSYDRRQRAPTFSWDTAARDLAEAYYARIREALLNPRIDPKGLLERFLPVLRRSMQSLLVEGKGVDPYDRTTWHLLRLASFTMEACARRHDDVPRQSVSELLTLAEALVSATQAAPRFDATVATTLSRLVETTDALAKAVAHCILAWADADPPKPWLERGPPLSECPIRHRLALRLGFPLCLYFGRLIEPSYSNRNARALRDEKKVSESRDGIGFRESLNGYASFNRVLALGAAHSWRLLYDRGRAGEGDLVSLFTKSDPTEALAALEEVVKKGTHGYPRLIGATTRFTVAFFVSLDADRSPQGLVSVPKGLSDVLVPKDKNQNQSYAILLGQLIANTESLLGAQLEGLLTKRSANYLLAKRVLCCEKGWESFVFMDDARREHGLLRLLFALRLVVLQGSRNVGNRLEVRREILNKALQLAPGNPEARTTMEQFFDRAPNYALALRSAAQRAQLPALPGWPQSVQPRQTGNP